MNKQFKVKIDSKIIDCQTYTLEDYMKILVSRRADNSDEIKKVFDKIIKKYTDAKNLSKHEAELLLINLIAYSQNETGQFKINYGCDCGETIPVNLKLNQTYIDYNDTDINELYNFNKFKLKLKWPDLWDDDDIPSMIAKCIEAVYVGNERIEIDDLNEQEIVDLYSAISEDDIMSMKNILLSPKPVLPVAFDCPKCGKKHIESISGFKKFIEVL